VALVIHSVLFARRAVGEGNVVVGNVVEKVEFFFLERQTGCDGVDGSISPALVEETAVLVESLKVVEVGGATEPVEVTDFKV
jgi:hypothetical protein